MTCGLAQLRHSKALGGMGRPRDWRQRRHRRRSKLRLMRRFLLPLWVLVGLAVGAALLARGHARPAAWVWSTAAAPIAVHVAADALRALVGGRLGVDLIALAAI